MKVLTISHSYIVELNRGKWREFVDLDANNEVNLIVPRRWRPGGVMSGMVNTQPIDDGRFRVTPVSNFHQSNQSILTFGPELIDVLRQFKPDVIQAELTAKALAYTQTILLSRFLKLNAVNVFFTWWNLPYELKFPVNHLEQFNLNQSHGAICGNQAGQEILRNLGFCQPIAVMPQLGIDQKVFFQQSSLETRHQLGIRPDDFVVGFVGRFVEEKGLLTLIKSLFKLEEAAPGGWRCLLVGQGPLKETMIAAAGRLSDQICFTGAVPHTEISKYINAMDVLVLPSEMSHTFKTHTTRGWAEQFGHVLIEAMACNVPVIGSDSGAIPEVIGECGLVFPAGDESALARCFLELLVSPELRQSLTACGYKRVEHLYTNRALAKQAHNFYENLLEKKQ